MQRTVGLLAGALLVVGIPLAVAAQGPAATLTVRVVEAGPTAAVVDAARRSVVSSPAFERTAGGADVRLVSFQILDDDRYRASLFDYTHNRAYVAEAAFGGSAPEIRETGVQPEPDSGEFARAVDIAARDAELGPALRKAQLVPYRPMPPLVAGDLPAGSVHRILAVGLAPRGPGQRHEIVGVDMIRRAVVRYRERAPETSRAGGTSCGLPSAGQPTTDRGTPGQVALTISRGQETLWTMIAIRPSASSGTRGSGIELRDVFYKGKKVFARAHVPILNVHYDGDACGPYRDWQWLEGSFWARGRSVAAGVRPTREPPATILDNHTDTGNFRGLAYYVHDGSVTLVSEMEAGWYRYISKWTFDADGTIHPRFGFDGVSNSCICTVHHHNVYWRLDFDVVTPANNQVSVVNAGTSQVLTAEVRQLRQPGRSWQVRNTQTGEAYSIVPGPFDGTADSYAKGDFWLLRSRPRFELDDGVDCTSCGTSTAIQLDRFVEPETLTAASNVTVWYGAHFDHDVNAQEEHNVVGPDLVPVGFD